jgi:hypothetical protein
VHVLKEETAAVLMEPRGRRFDRLVSAAQKMGELVAAGDLNVYDAQTELLLAADRAGLSHVIARGIVAAAFEEARRAGPAGRSEA